MTGQLGVAKLAGALITANRIAWAEPLTLTEALAQAAGTFPNCLLGCSSCLMSGIRRQ